MTSDRKKGAGPKANARITEEENELLVALSQEKGVTTSEYIRQSLRAKMMEDILLITKVKMTDGSPMEIQNALSQLIKGETND
jgi:hypothetical protein